MGHLGSRPALRASALVDQKMLPAPLWVSERPPWGSHWVSSCFALSSSFLLQGLLQDHSGVTAGRGLHLSHPRSWLKGSQGVLKGTWGAQGYPDSLQDGQ